MPEEYCIRDGVLEQYRGREEVIRVPEGIHTIGEGALKGCVSLKKVILPSGLKVILGDAFKGCRKLEEVEIPDGVTYIGAYAFHRCHELKKALLPPSVEELGDCAFLYCDSLREVRIPGVKRLGTQAFANGTSLESLEVSGDLEEGCICDVFTGCGRITKISIANGECYHMPNVVEAAVGGVRLPSLVRTIVWDILRMMELEGRCLVRFRVNIKHVEVPEGIECLGKSCFYDMRGIITVKLPKSLQSIQSKAFRNCISLEKVYFGSGQVKIERDAFRNCTSLKNVITCDGNEYTFEGISRIRGNAMEGAVSTDVPPSLVYAVHQQVFGNFRLSGTILLKYIGAESRVIIPEGITRIAEKAFAGKENIDKVILPDSLREIGAEAFRDCLLLQTIQLPEGVERIGQGAFENCVKLLRLSLPSGITVVGARSFRHCRALREIQLPEGLLTIEESAFYGCDALKNIRFPESLTLIGEMAFYRCKSLKEVRLPAGTTCVKSLAFAKSGIRRAWVSGSGESGTTGRMYGESIFADCVKLKTLLLEEGVRHMPDKFAWGCSALEQVILPDSLESVGRHTLERTAFLEQWRAKQAARPQEALSRARGREEYPNQAAGPQEVLNYAAGREECIFWDGRNLEGEVYITEPISIVAGGAFYGNTRVREVHLPECVHSIGGAAFKGCKSLRKVWWPEGIVSLEPEVFSGCQELEEIVLTQESFPFPVWEALGERAFYQCLKLRRLRLERTESIGKEALAGCGLLVRSEVEENLKIGERAFEDTCFLEGGKEGICIVGNVVVSGGLCMGEVSLPEGVAGIAPYAFSGNHRVTKLSLPHSLLWIGEGAFLGCANLEEVVFPANLREIGARSFEKCVSLREVESGAWEAGEAAFAGCVSLVRAKFPNLPLLGKRLFAACYSLEECICENAREVWEFCFSGCKKLRKFFFDSLWAVGKYGFEGCGSITCVRFGDGAFVREHAFEDCSGLERIVLFGTEGRIRLWEYAFSGCTFLRRVEYQGKEWALKEYGDISSEYLPEMVRLLFQSALSCFEVDTSAEEGITLCGYRGAGHGLRIPGGIRRIGAEVFRDAMMLQEVEIPESVEYIGARAFHGTGWMEARRKESPLVAVRDMLLDGSGSGKEVMIPEHIRLICGWAFANGLEIEKICFPSGRIRVEEYAFRNCIHLREMILPDGTCVKFRGIEDREKELPPLAKQAVMDSLNCFKTDEKGILLECTGNISRLTLAYGITAVGDGAFQEGNLLTEITFQETVKRIGNRAFAGCKWLCMVKGAQGVEEIGAMAFSGCGTLRQAEFSQGLRKIGARAFENCTCLEEIFLPEGLEEIPERAFYRCHSLRNIIFPSTLKKIGREAFAFCKHLEGPRIPEGVCVEERAFYRTSICE